MPTNIQFYHLTTTPLERALPKLLEKAYAGKLRTLLLAESDEQVERLNQLLWTYDPNGFLPHGSVKEGNIERQPILLATADYLTSQPACSNFQLLLTTGGHEIASGEPYERIIDMFDGNDETATANARTRWKHYKDAGHSLTYLRQNAAGGWEQAAAA